jgi:ribose/xylose/arabinose/galactoside ABC-type transport system permease subunit
MKQGKGLHLNPNVMQILIITAVFLVMVVFLTINSEHFLTVLNISNLVRQTAFTVIVGCAATLLVVSGNIDVSAGSNMAITCTLFAMLCKAGVPLALSALICCGVGMLVGVFNGLLSVKMRIPSIIVTMGTMSILRGLAFTICGAKQVTGPFPTKYFSFMGRGVLFGIIPFPLIITLVVLVIFLFIERKTLLGKYSVAVGGNKTAAEFAGIDTVKIQIILFSLMGLMVGLAGVLMASRLGIGEPKSGYDFEFTVMIAVILGGTNIRGGEGKILGTVVGALIVGILNNGMDLLNIQSFYQYVVRGMVLILAILLTNSIKRNAVRLG